LQQSEVASLFSLPGAIAFDADTILDMLLLAGKRWDLSHSCIFLDFLAISGVHRSQLLAVARAAIQRGHIKILFAILNSSRRLGNMLQPGDLASLLHELLDSLEGEIEARDILKTMERLSVPDLLATMQRLAAAGAAVKASEIVFLPHTAESFSKEEFLGLMERAVASGSSFVCNALLDLTVAKQLSTADLVFIIKAATSGSHVVTFDHMLSTLPGFQELDAGGLVELMQLALSGGGGKPLCEGLLSNFGICRPPNSQRLQQLYEAILQSGNLLLLRLIIKCPYIGCPGSMVAKLLRQAIAGGHELAACELMKVPATQDLSIRQLQKLKRMAEKKGMEVVPAGLNYILQYWRLRKVSEAASA
jgi:hypothetical protein